MIRDHSRFKDLAAGAQSVAIIIAVLSGGIWALLTLELPRERTEYELLQEELRRVQQSGQTEYQLLLGELERGRAEYQLLLAELEHGQAEYQLLLAELRPLRVVNIDIQSSSTRDAATGQRLLVVSVELQNAGRTTEELYWPELPLLVSRVTASGARADPIPAERLGSLVPEAGLRLMPGVRVRRIFVAPVAGPGLYQLWFQIDASEAEQQLAEEEGVRGRVAWAEESYVIVD